MEGSRKGTLVAALIVGVGIIAAVVAQVGRSASGNQPAVADLGAPAIEAGANPSQVGASPSITVYKSPTCGCCGKWVEHLEANGFEVTAIDTNEMAVVKSRHGVGPELASCHTAVVNGYVIEGHVPADLILTLLEERPTIAGLAVPGMPIGSPGMEDPSGRKDPYDVLAFDKDGNTEVYASR